MKKTKWEPFTIDSIFTIGNGIRLTKSDMTEGLTPFVGATDSNNGITAFCGNINNSADSNVLGVNYNGSVAECFYHPYLSIFSDDVKRLHLKDVKDNKYVFLFIKVAILKQKKKYEYGYKFNAERMAKQKISLPVKVPGVPDYAYMEKYMKDVERRLLLKAKMMVPVLTPSNGLVSENTKKDCVWIEQIFHSIQRGKRLKTGDHIPGKIPYVSSSAIDNGVDSFIGNEANVRKFKNCLTLANSGSVGATFYHPYEFIASDHVTKLENLKFNKYVYLYLSVITSRLSEKYSFNHEINEPRLKREQLFVPVDANGVPDYAYMESYMRAVETKLMKRYINSRLAVLSEENE